MTCAIQLRPRLLTLKKEKPLVQSCSQICSDLSNNHSLTSYIVILRKGLQHQSPLSPFDSPGIGTSWYWYHPFGYWYLKPSILSWI